MLWERCPDFDPSTLNPVTPPVKPPPKPNGGGDINDPNNNSTTEVDIVSGGVNIIAIVIGVVVPLLALGGIGVAVWLYCRNKKNKEAEDLADARKKKKEEGGEV